MRLRSPVGDDDVSFDAALDPQALRVRRTAAEALVVRGVPVLEKPVGFEVIRKLVARPAAQYP